MMKKFTNSILLAFALVFAGQLFGQNTIGVLTLDEAEVMPGYNLVYLHNQPNVYLFDNCGRVVHMWEDSATFRPGNTAYLMDNGDIIKTKRYASIAGDAIWAGGGGHFIERRDWDNNLLWKWGLNTATERLHHDISILPNGNILAICWELIDSASAVAEGRDPNLLPDGELWPDKVIEIKPIGTDSAEIVWEWRSWEHLIQDFDSTKNNFGVVGNHPELIDLNYVRVDGADDWHHMNAIDYDPDLDQIVVSVPTFNEIWYIDHSTSAGEVRGHSGGNFGKGGDLIFRWGNPMTYDQGDTNDIQLGYQHDCHWIDFGLTPSHPDYGKMMIFNNRIGGNYSSVEIIEPLFDSYNFSYLFSGNSYAPASPSWTYQAPTPTDLFSGGLSGSQRLRNGNTLIVSGRQGWAFELDANENIIWEWINPIVQGSALTQGDTIVPGSNLFFRMTRYSWDHPAFAGRTLSAGDYLELNPDTTLCPFGATNLEQPSLEDKLAVYPNPAQTELFIDWTGTETVELEIVDLLGKTMSRAEMAPGTLRLPVSHLANGLYVLRIDNVAAKKFWVRR